MRDVVLEVVVQEGVCTAGHQVGDRFQCGKKTPGGLCAAAYCAVYPTVRALALGAKVPWANADGSVDMACPDHKNPLVLRLRVQ